jgi:hypothetical protein
MKIGDPILLEQAEKAWENLNFVWGIIREHDKKVQNGEVPNPTVTEGIDILRKCVAHFEKNYEQTLITWEKSFSDKSPTIEYHRLNQLLLHCILSGEGGSETATELRNEMDEWWAKMTPKEQKAAREKNEKALGDA